MIRKGERVCGVPDSMVQLSQANKRIAELEAENKLLRRGRGDRARVVEDRVDALEGQVAVNRSILRKIQTALRDKEALDGEEG